MLKVLLVSTTLSLAATVPAESAQQPSGFGPLTTDSRSSAGFQPATPTKAGRQEPHDAAKVKAEVERVLAEPEFRHLVRPKPEEREYKLPNWLERLLDWLFKNRNWRVRFPSLPALLFQVLLYALALAVVVLVAALIIRTVWDRWPRRQRERPGVGLPDDEAMMPSTPPGELPADEYVRRAMELAERGDYRGGIRQLLLGAMSWIERAGLIRYRRGLTNRDYLRAVWRRVTCRDAMSAIIGVFERVYFGRRTATAEGFDNCLAQYRTGFATDETVTSLAS